MAKNITKIPYTELQERVIEIARVPENGKSKVRGLIQDVYAREIASKFDWNFLMVSSSITTYPEYKTGNATINTGSRIVTFSTDTILIDSMNGRKIKFVGNEVVYEITSFISVTSIQILPPFNGNNNITNGSFTIFQPIYPLSNDFDRFPKNGGVYKWEGGKTVLPEEPYNEYMENFSASPSVPEKVRIVGRNTAGTEQIEFTPPPKDARNYGYDYMRQVTPLLETSAGVVTIAANGTTVTGSTASRFREVTSSAYLRIDAFGVSQDSSWYPILNVANDSSLTLSSAFANTAVTSANYVVSSIPEYPDRLHPAVLHGTLKYVLLDQNDDSFAAHNIRYAETLSDSKRIHVTRVYDQKIQTIAEDWNYRR